MWTKGLSTTRKDSANNKSNYSGNRRQNLDFSLRRFPPESKFLESRLSYYRSTQALDFTTGNPRSVPGSLDAALGRRTYPDEARQCFGCHSTAATTNDRFDPTQLIPGVACEGCHGPGAQHVAEMGITRGLFQWSLGWSLWSSWFGNGLPQSH